MTPINALCLHRHGWRWLNRLALVAMVAMLGACQFGTPKPLFMARGRVLDEAERPVPGAVVTDGAVSVLTDEAGRYALSLYRAALTVRKPGYAAATLEATAEGAVDIALRAAAAPARVGLDARWNATSAKGLAEGSAVGQALAPYPATPLESLDVLVMLAPGTLDAAEQGRLGRWVRAGGRLIVCAEWGGFPRQDLDGLNALVQPAGITFTGATVKAVDAERPEWLTIPSVSPPSLGSALGSAPLHLFTSSSLALAAPARPFAQTDRPSYGVLAATGVQVVGAVGPLGAGKVFALGDTSLWLDADSDGSGTPNLSQGGNSRLLAALSGW